MMLSREWGCDRSGGGTTGSADVSSGVGGGSGTVEVSSPLGGVGTGVSVASKVDGDAGTSPTSAPFGAPEECPGDKGMPTTC